MSIQEPASAAGKPVVAVTGGSRGIGAAVARAAARQGWAVCLSYRNGAAEAGALAAEIEAAGGEALAVQGDVAEEADVSRLFAAVDQRFGRLDGLVNNAGILGRPMAVDATDAKFMSTMLQVNVAGYFLCLREAVKRMRGRGGSIVNIGSRLSELGGGGGYVLYAAAKGAVDSLTVGAARELAQDGIRVNCVSPGVIETEIHETTGIPDRAAKLTAQIPMGRPGRAEEVADAVVWLLSQNASYVTGTKINVSGGR